MTAPRRQRGVALIVALLVVAIAVILVAALLDRGELALARTRNVLRGEQAEAYALGLEAYAGQVLAARPPNERDTNNSPWVMPLPPQDVPGGTIAGSMRDLDGCFNLNNLRPGAPSSDIWKGVFQTLLVALQLDPALATPIEGWLDPARADTEEANHYLSQPVPYRPRGDLFVHVSELRLVRGIDAATYARLAPHVCALPPGTTINVNTATLPVLWALTGSQAAAESRWQGGHAQIDDLGQFLDGQPPLATSIDRDVLRTLLSINSNDFLLRGDIVLDGVPFTSWSVIHYETGGTNGGVHVIARSRGSDEALAGPAPIAPAGTH